MPLDIPKDWIGKVTVTDTACTVTGAPYGQAALLWLCRELAGGFS